MQGLPYYLMAVFGILSGRDEVQSKKHTAVSHAGDCGIASLHICLLSLVLSSISCQISEGLAHCLGAGVLRVDGGVGEVFESAMLVLDIWGDRVLKSSLGFRYS